MDYVKLPLRPGVVRDSTRYAQSGGWWDTDKVRFRMTPTGYYVEKIGGWVKYTTQRFLGTCRSLLQFRILNGGLYIGVGTNVKFYVFNGSNFIDVTPITINAQRERLNPFTTTNTSDVVEVALTGHNYAVGQTILISNAVDVGGIAAANLNGVRTVLAVNNDNEFTFTAGAAASSDATGGGTVTFQAVLNDPFTAVNGSTLLTVTEFTAAQRNEGDFIIVSGSTGVGGIPAGSINGEHAIVSVLSDTQYTIDTGVNAFFDETGGGAEVAISYLLANGQDIVTTYGGWDTLLWDSGQWDVAEDTGFAIDDSLALWTQDNFGEDLITCRRNAGIWYWDATNPNNRMIPLGLLSGATSAPTRAVCVLVSPLARHVIAFGTTPLGGGAQDTMLIRWSSSENAGDWLPTTTNTAGDIRLSKGTKIVCAFQSRQEILIWTDIALFALRYIGGNFVFGQEILGDNISIISPNAVAIFNDVAYWMGNGVFYKYDGTISRLICPIESYVKNNVNFGQAEMIYAGVNAKEHEIMWFYPKGSASDCTSYICYNVILDCWYFGDMSRTAWIHGVTYNTPLAAGTDGYLYSQETGSDDGSTDPVTPLVGYARSAPFEFGGEVPTGNRTVLIRRIVHDVDFSGSSSLEQNPTLVMRLTGRDYPGSPSYGDQVADATVTNSVESVVTEFTPYTDVRLRARTFEMEVYNDPVAGIVWRLGVPRVDVREGMSR